MVPGIPDKIPYDQEIIHISHILNNIKLIVQTLFQLFHIAAVPLGKPVKTQLVQVFPGCIALRDIEFRKLCHAEFYLHITALGYLVGIFQSLRCIGKQSCHLLHGFHVILAALIAHSVLVLKPFAGAQKLANLGINAVGVPGTIDLDIACTEYTIGFDTAVNTAMEAIDKVRDTSTSHERVSIIEVMGRNAGYLALWCGIANGAEDVLLPEKYDYDEQQIINNIIDNRKKGKKHHIIINAEGIGHSEAMAKRIEAATGIETRATILGHMQRGGSPTCKDRVYASIMGAKAVDVLLEGKTKRVIGYKNGEYVDFDINEALAMKKTIPDYQFEISYSLSHNYSKNV